MMNSHATVSGREHAFHTADVEAKLNLRMASFGVLKDEYYFGIKLQLTYTDCTMCQNAMISGFPAAIIQLVTTLTFQHV